MAKCLVTKLNASIEDNSILRLGEARFKRVSNPNAGVFSQAFSISTNKSTKIEILGNGYFTDKTLSQNLGKYMVLNAGEYKSIYTSQGDYEIAVLDKYAITALYSGSREFNSSNIEQNCIYINLDNLAFTSNITDFRVSSLYGKIDNLKRNTKITNLAFGTNQNITGDLAIVAGFQSLESLKLTNDSISCDLSYLENLVNIKTLMLRSKQVTGNLSLLSNLKKLERLDLYSSINISGDISSLSGLTKIEEIILYGDKITGNLSSLSSLSNLSRLELKKTQITGDLATLSDKLCYFRSESSYSWSSRSSSANIISIEGAKFENVDKVLQDQARCNVPSSVSNKIISIIGTRTSASDAAIQTLQSKGYTVSVTPA